ncbi:hypothetical protein C8Q78DRAFT_490567 [Trametes maxima]|nr:hypothetical protein C8Q78DRAFT_490567 [Trametes maxima]
MAYRHDLSPAQAPLNCCGLLPRTSFSSKILAKLRPRHFRKLVYQSRLHEGNADLAEARRRFGYCQQSLPLRVRQDIEVKISGLELHRGTFGPFSDYYGSHRAQNDALNDAGNFRNDAKNLLIRVKHEHESWVASLAAQKGRKSDVAARSPVRGTYKTPSIHRITGPTNGSRSTVRRDMVSADEPLSTVQIRAGPVPWTPTGLGHDALDLELGPRQSPCPRMMTPPRPPAHGSPLMQASPWTPASSLGWSPQLASFSPPPGARRTSLPHSLSQSSYRQNSSPGSSGTIQSSTSLPPVVESPSSLRRSALGVTYADHRSYRSPHAATRHRVSPVRGTQPMASVAARRMGTARSFRPMQSPLRSATVPETQFPSNRPVTFTP